MSEPEDVSSESLRIYQWMFEGASDGLFLVKLLEAGEFRYVEVNPAGAEALGMARDEIVGRGPGDLFPEEVAEEVTSLYRQVIGSGEPEETTRTTRLPGGEIVTRTRLQPIEHPDGTPGVLVMARDVTELERARRELEEDRRALRELYEVAGDPELAFDEQLRRLLEIGCERLGLPFGFITDISDGTQTIREAVGGDPELTAGATAPLEESYCRKTIAADDDLVAYENAPAQGFADDPAYERFQLGCYVGAQIEVRGELVGTICFADRAERDNEFGEADRTFVRLLAQWVSREFDRHALVARLAERANTDGLTGLANREAILERLEEERERASRYEHDLSFLLVDLDHFKSINDEYGHWIGDQVLGTVASLLERETRTSDLVGRYGGEEFAIVAPETDCEGAVQLAERITDRIRRTPVAANGEEVRVTCSIGVAQFDLAAQSLESVVMRADAAMYDAKEQGRDCVVAAE